VFADGLTAVCPYLVFATHTPQPTYPDSDFLVGNILAGKIAEARDRYDLAARPSATALSASPTPVLRVTGHEQGASLIASKVGTVIFWLAATTW
jgi:hypothetical protein